MAFDFGVQDKIGKKGEAIFLAKYPEFKHIGSDIWTKNDFVNAKGEVVELKTDTYDMDRTPNFFIEVFSKDTTFSPGGFFRSNNATYYVYFFLKNRTAFWFKPEDLIRKMDNPGFFNRELIKVANLEYNTLGLTINRDYFNDILLKKETW